MLPPIRAELGLSGYEAGLINTLFTAVVAVMSPLAGALGDRLPKHRVLFLVVAVWSAGTSAVSLASTFLLLAATRSFVTAAAESFYPPVSHAFLADHFTSRRALAMSIHQTAMYAGPVATGFLAGWLAERIGWRHPFLIFGGAGIVLSVAMALRLRPAESAAPAPGGALFGGFAHCWRIAAVRRIGLAFAGVLFVSIGYSTWAPTIFGRQFGLSLSQAGFQTAFWTSIPAMGGALLGGALSDHFAARGRARIELQAAALLFAAPCVWWLGAASTLAAALAALAGTGFFRGMYEGTIAVTLYDFVDAKYRSSAAAVVLVLANLLASPSSALLGWIGDRSSLGPAVEVLSICFIVSAAILWSARKLPRFG